MLLRTLILLSLALSLEAATSTWLKRTADSTELPYSESPYGYWEFLPSAYHENPGENYPVLIFLHGNGKFGDGNDTDLNKLLTLGQPKIINTPTHPLHNIFEDRSIIVLAPQKSSTWGGEPLRNYLDYVFETYRIDRRRVYVMGNSGGAGGIHGFMNLGPDSVDITAAVPTSIVGNLEIDTGGEVGAVVPYWVVASYGDSYGGINRCSLNCNVIAGARLGTGPTDVKASYPGNAGDKDYCATFDEATGWTWEQAKIPSNDKSPRMTIYKGSSHGAGEPTYGNIAFYDWMFAQVKPTVTISSPASGLVSAEGAGITFSASAQDMHGAAIDGSRMHWRSSLDGELGTGASIVVDSLSPGVHTIDCLAVDVDHRGGRAQIEVTVPNTNAFRVRFDFGSNSLIPVESGWNVVTDKDDAIILNVSDVNEQASGLRMDLVDDFHGLATNGVDDNTLYVSEAQRDTFYVGETNPRAEILIGGLDPALTYDFVIFASRATTSGASLETIYTIRGETQRLEAKNNTDQVLTFSAVVPDATGKASLVVERDPAHYAWVGGYLGVLEIISAGAGGGAVDSDADGLEDAWEQAQFGSLATDALADEDGDGLVNLLEYAFADGATDASEAERPAALVESQAGQDYLKIRYVRNRDALPLLDYVVECSTDLDQWSTNGLLETSVTQHASKPSAEIVEVRCTDPLTVPRYLRLRLVQR